MPIEKRKEFMINTAYFALIAVLVFLSIKYLLGLLLPFIIGLGIAALLSPAVSIISKKTRIPKKAAAVLLVILLYAVLGFVFFWLGVHFWAVIKELLLELPKIYSNVIEPAFNTVLARIETLAEGLEPSAAQVIKDLAKSLSGSVGSVVSEISSLAIQGISSAVSSIPSLVVAIVFAVISSLFFAVDYDRITGYIQGRFPGKAAKFADEAKAFAFYIGSKYVKGYALLMLITFAELSIGLSALGVDKSVLVAAFIALVDILPVLGTGGVVIPWIFIELVSGNISFAVGLTVVYVVVTIVRNILEPKIIGDQVGLHPLIMLICIFVGAKMFGVPGIIALPVCAVVVKRLYDQDKLRFGRNHTK